MQTVSAYLLNTDQTLLPNTANPQRAVTLEVLLNQTLSPLSSARLSPPSNPTNEVSSGQLQHSTDTGRTSGLAGRISLERTKGWQDAQWFVNCLILGKREEDHNKQAIQAQPSWVTEQNSCKIRIILEGRCAKWPRLKGREALQRSHSVLGTSLKH